MLKNKWLWVLPFVLSLLVGWYQINASGETWDEQYRYITGRKYVSNFLHLDFSYNSWGWQFEHPAASRYPYGLAAIVTERFSPNSPDYISHNLTLARAVSVLEIAVSAIFVFLIGGLLFTPGVGILASLVYSLLPETLAFSRIVSHEAPVLLFSAITIYFFLKAVLKNNNSRLYLWMGLFLGFALSTRFNNFIIIPTILLMFVVFNFKDIKKYKRLVFPLNLVIALLMGGVLFYVLWPWLWPAPFDRLVQSLNFWREQGLGPHPHNLFYYFIYYLVNTPALILALNLVFLVNFVLKKTFSQAAVFIWFILPFVFGITSYQQGGFRYVAVTLIPIALMAATGLIYLTDYVKSKKITIPRSYLLASLLLLVYLATIVIWFFPNYLDYYNEFVGGTVGAHAKGFPVGVWGNGAKGAIDWVNKNAPKGASVELAISPDFAAPKLRGDFKVLPLLRPKAGLPDMLKNREGVDFYTQIPPESKRADYLILYGMDLNIPSEYLEVYTVKVDNYPIAKVYQLTKKQ